MRWLNWGNGYAMGVWGPSFYLKSSHMEVKLDLFSKGQNFLQKVNLNFGPDLRIHFQQSCFVKPGILLLEQSLEDRPVGWTWWASGFQWELGLERLTSLWFHKRELNLKSSILIVKVYYLVIDVRLLSATTTVCWALSGLMDRTCSQWSWLSSLCFGYFEGEGLIPSRDICLFLLSEQSHFSLCISWLVFLKFSFTEN